MGGIVSLHPAGISLAATCLLPLTLEKSLAPSSLSLNFKWGDQISLQLPCLLSEQFDVIHKLDEGAPQHPSY